MSEPNDTVIAPETQTQAQETETQEPLDGPATVTAAASAQFTLGASAADPEPTVSDHAETARKSGFSLHKLIDDLEARLFPPASAQNGPGLPQAIGHSLHEMVIDASTLASSAAARLEALLERI